MPQKAKSKAIALLLLTLEHYAAALFWRRLHFLRLSNPDR
jgi:hypothetical protein